MYITFNALPPNKISKKDQKTLDSLIMDINDHTYENYLAKLKKHVK
jgi:hypothetical protein